jgi:hypothetical protein
MDEIEEQKVAEDWKEQIEAERVAGEVSGSAERPPVHFAFFVASLAMESWIALGEMASPRSGETSTNLDQARYLIDTLGMLEEKTRGNRSGEEEKILREALLGLRLAYMKKNP